MKQGTIAYCLIPESSEAIPCVRDRINRAKCVFIYKHQLTSPPPPPSPESVDRKGVDQDDIVIIKYHEKWCGHKNGKPSHHSNGKIPRQVTKSNSKIWTQIGGVPSWKMCRQLRSKRQNLNGSICSDRWASSHAVTKQYSLFVYDHIKSFRILLASLLEIKTMSVGISEQCMECLLYHTCIYKMKKTEL